MFRENLENIFLFNKIILINLLCLQLIFEGIRGFGIEGDIVIDDVLIVEGECVK